MDTTRPWHDDVLGASIGTRHALLLFCQTTHTANRALAGNATEPLLYIAAAVLLACVLSGKWIILAYAIGGAVTYAIVLLYALYLENNAQTELERQRQRQARMQRWGTRI
jgi:hypothetical protein